MTFSLPLLSVEMEWVVRCCFVDLASHGHVFMRIANWFSSLAAAFACCCLLLLADQALLEAVGGVVGAGWWLELLLVMSDECFRWVCLAASAIVDCSTIVQQSTINCLIVRQSSVRLLIVNCDRHALVMQSGQYSLHYFAIFMHGNTACTICTKKVSSACIKMA